MRLLHVTSEMFPLAKTGGLADVCASLPAALHDFDVETGVILPGYRGVLDMVRKPVLEANYDGLLGQQKVRLYSGQLPQENLTVWIVDCPSLYDRDGHLYTDHDGVEWSDNALRYALLCHVAVKLASDIWTPDIVHAHDWHAGLVPLLLSHKSEPRPASVFTIHNLAYQGLFSTDITDTLELPRSALIESQTEFYGRFSFLKAGLSTADRLTTVSPGYAREITSAEYGCGLDGLLHERQDQLTGIMNGIDAHIWNPAQDGLLEKPYAARKMAGKHVAKRNLQQEFGLEQDEETPLAIFMSRLDYQKMPDIVAEALPQLLTTHSFQVILIGEGDPAYQCAFEALAQAFPDRIKMASHYDEPLAHRALAGADILMHPARYEPCGLTPLYALRYGAIPVVRNCGGMADSVVDLTPATQQNRSACGFHFDAPTTDAFGQAMERALSAFSQPLIWRKLQSTAMNRDFSWANSARQYVDVYRQLLNWTPATKDEDEIDLFSVSA